MELVTVRNVAELLGVTVGRVHQLITAGRLPATKLGSQYVIKRDDLKIVLNRKPGRPVNNTNSRKIKVQNTISRESKS